MFQHHIVGALGAKLQTAFKNQFKRLRVHNFLPFNILYLTKIVRQKELCSVWFEEYHKNFFIYNILTYLCSAADKKKTIRDNTVRALKGTE
jgi:hypothetical protein